MVELIELLNAFGKWLATRLGPISVWNAPRKLIRVL